MRCPATPDLHSKPDTAESQQNVCKHEYADQNVTPSSSFRHLLHLLLCEDTDGYLKKTVFTVFLLQRAPQPHHMIQNLWRETNQCIISHNQSAIRVRRPRHSYPGPVSRRGDGGRRRSPCTPGLATSPSPAWWCHSPAPWRAAAGSRSLLHPEPEHSGSAGRENVMFRTQGRV